jgi:DNA-binding HxlR family transcriptional regulator
VRRGGAGERNLGRVRSTRDIADAPVGSRPRDDEQATVRWTHRQWTPLAHALAAIGDRWTLLIVLALAPGTMRLATLKDRLPGISSGVLDSHVGRLAQLGLVTRQRFREMPPRVELTLTDAGRELLPIAEALTRWGMRHTWSAPQTGERVDVGGLFGLLPAMLDGAAEVPDGTVAFMVTPPGRLHTKVLGLSNGHARLVRKAPQHADARLEGDQSAWVAALGPEHEYGSLYFSGDRELAVKVLDALPRAT